MLKLYFILILIIILFLSLLADKKNNKFIMIVAALILSLIGGLRGITVGVDTSAYYYAFNNNFPIAWQFEEDGFRIISMFFMKVFNNATYLMLLYSIITNVLIFLRLWDFRKKCNFSVMIFLYLFIYFLNTMNIMRQFICIAVIFYSTRYLEKKKYLLFLIITLLSTTVHKSSLLALLILFVYMWSELSRRKKILFAVPIACVMLVSLSFVLKFENDHITNYLSITNLSSNLNITFFYRLLIFVLSYLLIVSNKKVVLNKKNHKQTDNYDMLNEKGFKRISCIFFLGLCFSSMGMFFSFMTRFGLFYLIFELLYWGYLTKKSKNNLLNLSFISIYAIYIFLLELFTNGSGIFPYYFNF